MQISKTIKKEIEENMPKQSYFSFNELKAWATKEGLKVRCWKAQQYIRVKVYSNNKDDQRVLVLKDNNFRIFWYWEMNEDNLNEVFYIPVLMPEDNSSLDLANSFCEYLFGESLTYKLK